MQFFRPDALRIVLFSLFLVVAYFGWRDSVAFSDEAAPATLFWTLWMAILAPLGLLLLILRKAGMPFDLFRSAPVVFWLVQITYFYLLACAIAVAASVLQRLSSRITKHP